MAPAAPVPMAPVNQSTISKLQKGLTGMLLSCLFLFVLACGQEGLTDPFAATDASILAAKTSNDQLQAVEDGPTSGPNATSATANLVVELELEDAVAHVTARWTGQAPWYAYDAGSLENRWQLSDVTREEVANFPVMRSDADDPSMFCVREKRRSASTSCESFVVPAMAAAAEPPAEEPPPDDPPPDDPPPDDPPPDDPPPDDTPPTAPADLSAAAAGTERVDLAWTASEDAESGIDSYTIYRDGAQIGSSTAGSFADTGVDPSTTYSYEVSAVNGGGLEGPKSDPASATTEDPPAVEPPGLPGTPQFSELDPDVEVTWSPAERAESYRYTSSVEDGTVVSERVVLPLADGDWFCVWGVNSAGESAENSCSTYHAPDPPPEEDPPPEDPPPPSEGLVKAFYPSDFSSTEELRTSSFWRGSGLNSHLIDLVDDGGLGGKAMRYTYFIPNCRTQVITKTIGLPTPLREAWVYVEYRTSENFTTQDPEGCRPGDYKWIFGGLDLGDGRWGVNMGLHGSQWRSARPERNNSEPGTMPNESFSGASSTFDGRVHRIMLHWRYSTTPTSEDGFWEMWLDGKKVGTLTGSVNSDSQIDRIELGKNMSGHAPDDVLPPEDWSTQMYLYWGKVEVYDQDPVFRAACP